MKKTKLGVLTLSAVFALGLGGIVLSSCSDDKTDTTTSSADKTTTSVGLTLSESEVTLNVKGSKTITASTEDNDLYLITWSSSNKEIATVKSGTITGVAEGEATITASARKKGSTKVLESKDVKVTVTNHTLTLDKNEITISLSESSTAKLTAAVGGGASTTLAWTSDNKEVATVDETGLVTGHKSGDANITVSNGELSATCVVHVFANHYSLDKKAEVTINKTLTISVTGTPSSDAVWSSEDEKIATVSNGVVTGVALGMTKVHLKSVSDNVDAEIIIMVKGDGEEVAELPEGKKADALANPKTWYFLRENIETVTVAETPTIDNGLIHANITRVGNADGEIKGNNMFYLRYQPDETGDIIYKETLYVYSETESLLSINGGTDTTYAAGFNKITLDSWTSSLETPSQIKFKCTGDFRIIPVFEKTGEVKKMTLSETKKELDLNGEKEFTLTANVPDVDNPEVTWVSSNEKVATVSDTGLVTAVSVGDVTITATYLNYSATCTITVKNTEVIDTRTDLEKGKNDDVLANRDKWYWFADGSEPTTHKIGEDGKTIDVTVAKNTSSSGKAQYTYLRYAPTDGSYVATYAITYYGDDSECSINITQGSTEASDIALEKDVEKSGTYSFTIDSSNAKPFQFKFKALGSYKFVVSFAKAE